MQRQTARFRRDFDKANRKKYRRRSAGSPLNAPVFEDLPVQTAGKYNFLSERKAERGVPASAGECDVDRSGNRECRRGFGTGRIRKNNSVQERLLSSGRIRCGGDRCRRPRRDSQTAVAIPFGEERIANRKSDCLRS